MLSNENVGLAVMAASFVVVLSMAIGVAGTLWACAAPLLAGGAAFFLAKRSK